MDPTGRDSRKILLYPHENSQAGERGKKLIHRFWVKNPKVQIKAALPSPPITGTRGGWEPGTGAVKQLARLGSSAVPEQSTSRANEHRSLPRKRDLTRSAQAWGIQQERQAAPASWGRRGSSSWASTRKQPLLTAEAMRGLNQSCSVPRTACGGWRVEPRGSSNGEVTIWLHKVSPWFLLEAEFFVSSCSQPGDS